MSEQTTVYVAIAPKDKLEAGLAEKVAAIVKKFVRRALSWVGRSPR
jgi:hypothetical protein